MNRRDFLKAATSTAVAFAVPGCTEAYRTGSGKVAANLPNFVIIICDDLGYGDLSCYGHPTIRTSNLDHMAVEGQKWTDFYAAESVCTPSRAALLTGRLAVRSGLCGDNRRELYPDSTGGLPQTEITIAKALKSKGYATCCIGKWHLGHLPQYLPTKHGFDYYFGIPYCNDMDKTVADESQIFQQPKIQYWNVPLMRNDEIIERPADQNTITKHYSLAATNFIRKNKNRPFFLYLAHNMPHVPLFASPDFKNKSARGLYGDVVEEIDWGVGLILETLRREHLARNTLVVFTSDNGPWLSFDELAGSAGILREGKGSTFEGGMRVPCIMWWPGKIKPGIVRDIGCTMDLFTTILTLASADIPQDRAIDGLNLSPALFGKGPSPRNVMFFYRGTRLYAARKGPYKAHFFTKSTFGKDESVRHDTPLIYHLGQDPGEKYDLADRYPEVIADIQKEVIGHLRTLVVGEDQLTKRIRKR